MRLPISRVSRFAPAFVAALSIAAVAAPASAAFKFAIPDGWTDLSPGKEAPKEVPEQLVTMAQSGVYAAYAIDLAGGKDGFAENLNAVVNHRPFVADDASLEQYLEEFPAQVRREVPGAKVKVSEQGLQEIGGVPSLRLVADIEMPTFTMRTLQYVIPGGDETAALTYSATPDSFDQYLPTFEAAAKKTVGAAAAPMAARVGQKLLQTGVSANDWQKIFGFGGKVIGAIVGVLVVLLVSRIARRKKAAA
jgi:hypothetical protein